MPTFLAGTLNRDRNRPRPWLYVIATVPALLILTIVGFQSHVSPSDLLRDPIAVAQGAASRGECCKTYFGAVSQLGGVIWAGGGFIALFVAAAMRRPNARRENWQFMLAAGVITVLLAFDDLFMGHEALYPKLFGIPELITIAGYAALVTIFLWKFRHQIIAAAPALLAISLAAFALSVGTDLFVSEQTSWHRFGEDGSKFIGISTWTTFVCWSAWSLVNRSND